MNGNKKAIIDSNILIYCSNGILSIKEITKQYDELYVSVITYIETLGFHFENPTEKQTIEKLLDSFEIVQTNLTIAIQVVSYKMIKKIKTPDALILATANFLNADLITLNEPDFKGLDPTVKIITPIIIGLREKK